MSGSFSQALSVFSYWASLLISCFSISVQDDIVPRLSVASLSRLRNEILQTDW